MSTKLCWYHSQAVGVPAELKCTNSTLIELGSTLPSCQSGCERYQRCKRAFEVGGFPDAFWDVPSNFENPVEDLAALNFLSVVTKNIESFVNSGQNLYIHSEISGNGKTFRAISIAKAYIRARSTGSKYSDRWVSYVSIPKIVSDYDICEKMSYENEKRQAVLDKLHSLNKCQLVIWDDFGFGSGSTTESVILRSILANRISNKLSNIIISPYSLLELKGSLSKGDFQRLTTSTIDVELFSTEFRSKANNSWLVEGR